jgi:hypothetical protein
MRAAADRDGACLDRSLRLRLEVAAATRNQRNRALDGFGVRQRTARVFRLGVNERECA